MQTRDFVDSGGGWGLVLIPTYCVVCQTLPQGHSTVVMTLLLGLTVLLFGFMEQRSETDHSVQASQDVLNVWSILGRSFLLYMLSFYASVQNAPIQTYFNVSAQTSPGKPQPVYASHLLGSSHVHTLATGITAGGVRLLVYLAMTCFQNNQFHDLLEGGGTLYHISAWCYTLSLLYSAAWSLTQLTEQVLPPYSLQFFEIKKMLKSLPKQVLPWFLVSSPHQHNRNRLKMAGLILVGAGYYRIRWHAVLFWSSGILSMMSVLTLFVLISDSRHHHERAHHPVITRDDA